MSLINDALNKAQLERSQPRGASLYRSPGYRPPFQRPVRVKSLAFIWASVAIVAVLFAGGIWYVRHRPAPAAAETDAIAAANNSAVGTASALPAPEPQREPATVAPAPFAIAPAPIAPAPAYDLTGMSAMGSTTLLGVVRRSDKRSFWVPVGKTVGEITAVSYDATTDRAVIRVNGSLQTIALRDVGAPATAPAE